MGISLTPPAQGQSAGRYQRSAIAVQIASWGFREDQYDFFPTVLLEIGLPSTQKGSNLCVVLVLDTLANPSAVPAGMSEHAYPMNE